MLIFDTQTKIMFVFVVFILIFDQQLDEPVPPTFSSPIPFLMTARFSVPLRMKIPAFLASRPRMFCHF